MLCNPLTKLHILILDESHKIPNNILKLDPCIIIFGLFCRQKIFKMLLTLKKAINT